MRFLIPSVATYALAASFLVAVIAPLPAPHGIRWAQNNTSFSIFLA